MCLDHTSWNASDDKLAFYRNKRKKREKGEGEREKKNEWRRAGEEGEAETQTTRRREVREVAGDTDSYSGNWPRNDKAKIQQKTKKQTKLKHDNPIASQRSLQPAQQSGAFTR